MILIGFLYKVLTSIRVVLGNAIAAAHFAIARHPACIAHALALKAPNLAANVLVVAARRRASHSALAWRRWRCGVLCNQISQFEGTSRKTHAAAPLRCKFVRDSWCTCCSCVCSSPPSSIDSDYIRRIGTK